ncbi:MAG: endonuclease/exonuclease/phosphatase family protein [Pseudohongiellaceae bacterium]
MKSYWEKRKKVTLLLLGFFMLGGLSKQQSAFAAPPAGRDHSGQSLETDAELQQECQNLSSLGAGIDGDGFTLLNWNIKKGEIENWDADLMSLGGDIDLVLIQEATDEMAATRFVQMDGHWSFSQGYSTNRVVSGVATISAVQPIEQCRLLTVEPWLRTPKATMATRFSIQERDETLLVINTHMVNFTIGHSAFREQLAEVEILLAEHDGPVIFSGDFNTWRPARYQILLQMTARFGLTPITFERDNRARFFGSPVDHVFIAGLSVEEAETIEVETSDHNPMSLRFTL